MPRTKGSKNKKVVEVKVSSNFKSLEVKETKTEVFEIAISKEDIILFAKQKAKKLANFDINQKFEHETIVFDKKGNMFITLINPLDIILPRSKFEIKEDEKKSTDTSDKK